MAGTPVRRKCFIRVLSGPNKGAVAMVREGTHQVGSSFECDFVLMGAGVQERHLEISFVDGMVTVKPVDGEVEVSGRKVGDSPVNVFPGSIISLGGVDLLLNLKSIAKHKEQSGSRQGFGRSFASGAEWFRGARLLDDSQRQATRRIFRPDLTRLAVFAILALFVLVSLTGKDVVGSGRVPTSPEKPNFQRLNQAMAQLPDGSDVALRQSSSGRMQVVGHVLTSDQVRTLRKAIDGEGNKIDLRVTSAEELAAATRKVLDAIGLGALKVTPVAPGKLAWSGLVASPDELHAALVTIKSDIPRILDIDVKHVLTMPQLADELTAALTEVEYFRHLNVSIDDTRLNVNGVLSHVNQPELEALLARFMLDRNGTPDVRNQTSFKQSNGFKLNIKSISVGPSATLELVDGQKYSEGATLANGMVLEKISMQALILKDGTNSIEYPVGESK
ncbi:MAG: type III secretion system inner membrane ring subunit SctD [Thiotrichales bacterium]